MASGNSLSSKLLSGAMLATLIARLVPLFTGFASAEAARDAALAALLAYGPETEAEFALAAEIISFSLHSLDALARAIGPDVSLNQTLRLRGSAVSLSREAHKAQRKLDQMQKARRQGAPVTAAAETVRVEAQPSPAPAVHPVAATSSAPSPGVKPASKQTWTQAYHQRLRDKTLSRRQEKAAIFADIPPPRHDPAEPLHNDGVQRI
jgi:hypothetical protein